MYIDSTGIIFLVLLIVSFLIFIGESYDRKIAKLKDVIKTLNQQKLELQRSLLDFANDLVRYKITLADAEKELQQKTEKLREMEATIKSERESFESRIRVVEADVKRANADAIKSRQELSEHKRNLSDLLQSNLTSIPWLAGMMADFLTYDLEVEAKKLEWGQNISRQHKVASIRELRNRTSKKISEAKEAIYQLEYLRTLFPGIDDVLVTDYKDLKLDENIVTDHDPTLDYLSKEEWKKLTEAEQNQLALDRYVASRKSNWQIGRDYELSVAHEYMSAGFQVDTFGSYMGLRDLGRDLIAKKDNKTYIIQCKYWSQSKEIHEKHLYQLYGTVVGYCIENNIPRQQRKRVQGIFVTNILLSDMARKVAEDLNIHIYENRRMVDFPRIKCNIGKTNNGSTTKIFHLPMDQQYDTTKIEKPGEFYAFTVQEAMNAGFRRAYKWRGSE